MPPILPDMPYAHVRMVAPAAAVPQWALADVQAGVSLIEGRGYTVTFGQHTFGRHHYFSGTSEQRQKDFRDALEDDGVDVIWAALAGHGTLGALGSLSSVQVGLHPKWLVGYSDVTAAHVLWQQAGLVSIHGAMGKGLSGWSDAARNELFSLLDHAQPPAQEFTAHVLSDAGNAGVRSGVLWGGNLTILASLCGTTQLPPRGAQDTILFIEDNELNFRAHRSALQLLRCGALNQVQAVLLGQWGGQTVAGQAMMSDALYRTESLQMLQELLAENGIPVLAGLPVGHQLDSRPLLLGSWATVDLASGAVQLSTTGPDVLQAGYGQGEDQKATACPGR